MSEAKVWTPEERSAATETYLKRTEAYWEDGITNPQAAANSVAIDLQCEVNEAREILRTHPSLAGFSSVEQKEAWKLRRDAWLKRNEAIQ